MAPFCEKDREIVAESDAPESKSGKIAGRSDKLKSFSKCFLLKTQTLRVAVAKIIEHSENTNMAIDLKKQFLYRPFRFLFKKKVYKKYSEA